MVRLRRAAKGGACGADPPLWGTVQLVSAVSSKGPKIRSFSLSFDRLGARFGSLTVRLRRTAKGGACGADPPLGGTVQLGSGDRRLKLKNEASLLVWSVWVDGARL